MANHQELSNFIWQIADLLRGPYRPPQYERIMLPMTVLRRFDCVLEATKADVVAAHEKHKDGRLAGDALDRYLNGISGHQFHNHSPLTFEKLKGDPDAIDTHLVSYIQGFSSNVRDIFDRFEFSSEIERMREADILYAVVSKFCDIDLHPDNVDNIQMGLLFEDLIRRFNEQANETAGDYFTPREVIRLMVDILFANDDDFLSKPGVIRTLLDPACGTGGMLSEAQNYLREHHSAASLYVFGQDMNPRAYAIAASDLLIKGHENSSVEYGDSLIDDKFHNRTFDYFLANPPFGVDWKKQQKEIVREQEKQGYAGRFGAGLPRVNDGSLLFLQHMLSKFEPVDEAKLKFGSRLAIVFSGSPLFTGGAGSGESNIRKWIIENDWLDTIVALPEQMFYNTGIGTYVWIVTNRKPKSRKGKIQLIDARGGWKPMPRSLGDKRRYLGDDDIETVVLDYGSFANSETSRLFDNTDFGYTRVTVERPLRLTFRMNAERTERFLEQYPDRAAHLDEIQAELGAEIHRDWNAVKIRVDNLLDGLSTKWKNNEQKLFRDIFTERDPEAEPVIKKQKPLEYEPDTDLRDFENVPLKTDIDTYFREEVLPYVPDAWMDRSKDKIGYEINFNRYFYRYVPPRPLEEIDLELEAVETEIVRLLQEVTG